MSREGETRLRRTVRPHARVGWWPEGAELHTLTSRHRDTPLGILGTLAAGDPAAKLGPAQSAPVHASPLPDQQCRSASPATGRARPVGGEGKEPEPDAATILKLDIASGAAGDSVCSGIHTGETGFLGTSGTEGRTWDPNYKPWAGRGAGGRGAVQGIVVARGSGRGSCRPHRRAPAAECIPQLVP